MKASPSPSPLAPGTDQHVQGAQEEDGGEVDFEFKRRTDPAKFHLEASVRTERVARGRVSEAAAPLEGLVTGLGMARRASQTRVLRNQAGRRATNGCARRHTIGCHLRRPALCHVDVGADPW